MRYTRLPATVAAVLALATAAGAGTAVVSVTVKPRTALAGERVTMSARVNRDAGRCSGRIARTGAAAATLPAKTPARRSVSWKWTVPTAARTGPATARVTCRRAGSGEARFTVRALPVGDPVPGKTVFLLNCGGCHTLADAGTTGTSVDLDEKKPSYTTAVDRVINGKGLMPAFRTRLTPQQIADVSAYVAAAAGRP